MRRERRLHAVSRKLNLRLRFNISSFLNFFQQFKELKSKFNILFLASSRDDVLLSHSVILPPAG